MNRYTMMMMVRTNIVICKVKIIWTIIWLVLRLIALELKLMIKHRRRPNPESVELISTILFKSKRLH
jgi:hypothetical protein